MKEHKIGRKFKMTIDGVESYYKLDHSKDYLSCEGCALKNTKDNSCNVKNNDEIEFCAKDSRSDNTDVIFIKL